MPLFFQHIADALRCRYAPLLLLMPPCLRHCYDAAAISFAFAATLFTLLPLIMMLPLITPFH